MVFFQRLDTDGATFTVRPNCSLSWVGMKRLFWVLAGCIGAVAAYFAALGAWLVLPFAGLEIAVLGIGLYLNAHEGFSAEIIEIAGQDVRIWRGRGAGREMQRLPRYWTRVALRHDPRGWYPSRLLLSSHGRHVEVGSRLVESERVQLAEDLRYSLGLPAGRPQGGSTEQAGLLEGVGIEA